MIGNIIRDTNHGIKCAIIAHNPEAHHCWTVLKADGGTFVESDQAVNSRRYEILGNAFSWEPAPVPIKLFGEVIAEMPREEYDRLVSSPDDEDEWKIGDLVKDANHDIPCLIVGINEDAFHAYTLLKEDGGTFVESRQALDSRRYDFIGNLWDEEDIEVNFDTLPR